MTADARAITPGVDIIVPVYRNLAASRRCVASVLASTNADLARVIIVEDASPEPDLVDWCVEQGALDRVTLIRNEANLGFVRSVNRGMAAGSNDVVLLNSDTEVPQGWLERLRTCAASQPRVATVTPFSNNATICSYPLFCRDSNLPGRMSLEDLDRLFASANAGMSCELPTAVGFCVYIRREALSELGLFDEEAFGRGYGEENDFSRRAAERGWTNLLCADLYVYHEGGVSFGADAEDLKTLGNLRLVERHPDYPDLIAGFIANDPLYPFRDRVDRLRRELPGQADFLLEEGRAERSRLQASAVLANDLDLMNRQLGSEIDHCRERVSQYEARCEDYEARCGEYEQHLSDARELARRNADALALTQDALKESLQVRDQLTEDLAHANNTLQQIYRSRTWRFRCWLRRLIGTE